ncbi:MAG TPA: hypothetical protein VGH81_03645 [Rudaea sp.]|jgi:hypothetical protein
MPMPGAGTLRCLLFGHDTVECSYYASPTSACAIDFDQLAAIREGLRQAAQRGGREIELGGVSFLLRPNGTQTGYPFVIVNPDMTVCLGPNNVPPFFVKYHSTALWREGIAALHGGFIAWLSAIGFEFEKETLARVDLTFDYYVPEVDFDEDAFVSLATKDAQHRSRRSLQGLRFGQDEVVLRVYDKIAEIKEQSHKTWFFALWGESENVWRFEWQVRKNVLHRFGIRSIESLLLQQGDLLRYLAQEHDSLRIPTQDSNRSRWPLHPLWIDLQSQISSLPATGIYREVNLAALLEERLARIAISFYGNCKQVAAIHSVRNSGERIGPQRALREIAVRMLDIHDSLSWKDDVSKRVTKLRLEAQ